MRIFFPEELGGDHRCAVSGGKKRKQLGYEDSLLQNASHFCAMLSLLLKDL
jgi:hypothetical protein